MAAAGDKLMTNPAAPTTPRGHTFHVHVKTEEVANRILVVGDQTRAARIAEQFDADTRETYTSERGYVTYTGKFRGTRVTVCAHLIGYPNLDIVVRELRVACRGPMAVIRLGTCGGLGSTPPGALSVPSGGAVLVRLEPDFRGPTPPPDAPGGLPSAALPYSVSQLVHPDAALTALLEERAAAVLRGPGGMGADWPLVTGGSHASADSFYSAQGRPSNAFDDRNAGLLAALTARVPGIATLEMETFHLFELARATTAPGADPAMRIHASGAHIVLVNREEGGGSATVGDVHRLETLGGRAALEALCAFAL